MNNQTLKTRPFHWISVFGPLLFVAAIATIVVRADLKHSEPGEIVDSRYDSNQGYRDFHNAIYFPVRALITGVNPYSAEYQNYHPDGLGFPPFAPSSVLLHAPLGFLTVGAAEVAYLIINICLLIFICWFSVRKTSYPYAVGAIFLMAALMVISRPGLLNFFGLQMTLLLIVGTLLALEYSESNPVLSGFGLLLACCKPTYVIPLGIMMLFRRNFSAFAIGVLLCAMANAGAVWMIASQNGGVENFVEDVDGVYSSALSDPVETPKVRTSWSRLDAYSVVARWLDVSDIENLNFMIPMGVLAVGAMIALMEIDPNHRTGVNSRTGLLAILVMLTSIYHQPYDALVLWIPLAAFFLGDLKVIEGFSSLSRFLLVMLLMIPMVNFVSTKLFLDRMGIEDGASSIPPVRGWEQFLHVWPWKLAVTFNGIALVLAIVIVGMAILRNWDHQRVPI